MEQNIINWEDGCWRTFYYNGHEKDSKVIARKKGERYWYLSFRDENGNILNEYYGEKID